MNLREFVGAERIAANFVGQPTQPEWDMTLSEEDVSKLGDPAYLEKIQDEHRELSAFMTARYGSSIYPPDKLATRMKIPLLHVFGFYGLRGNKRLGTY
jgi:hypothetical protein